jgi:regulator of protease activity HflC (stomatin/prohibitin superfamily)
MEKLPKIGLPIIIAFIFLVILLARSVVTIGAGEGGVLYKPFAGGVVTDQPPMNEGFHVVLPWNKVFVYELRQQELPEKLNVLSSNGLNIGLTTSIWFRPEYANLGKLHQEKGERYVQRILKPAVEAAARSVVGRYTPEQLYSSKRDAIQTEIEEETKKLLAGQYIDLVQILVSDVSLPPTIKDAIERKLSQEQEALEYEFRLQKAEQEAERQRIDAEGKATANLILNASLTEKILKEKGIQATVELSKSNNAKVVIIGSGAEGMPIILGNN